MIDMISPAIVNLIPRLNAFVLGLNIQKLEITKKKRETPKNTLKGDIASLDCDL
jgi:hypothetical protein